MTTVTQPTLFDRPAPYHHDGPATELEAAEANKAHRTSLRTSFLRELRREKRYGATRDELDALYGTTPNVSQPRLSELREGGYAKATKYKRKTRSNRNAAVWMAVEYIRPGDMQEQTETV
jgi:hypothetical protein